MTERPTQAVIFAGGRGTRLGRLTADKPKPMMEFHGKPFLQYLIEMFRNQGFDRILLLLGYRPQVVQDYFGTGGWGVSIDYSVTPVENETGRRLKIVEARLDPVFLLAYCDNYWPLDMARMWPRFVGASVSALVTVYQNPEHPHQCNMTVDGNGLVTGYDKSRKLPGLNGNDIGFMLIRKEVLDLIPDENASFEMSVFPTLIARGALLGWTTQHRYYSVGSEDRLTDTREFLLRRPTVLVDRDGVLNRRMGRAEYVCKPADWEWLPGSLEALRRFHVSGFRVIIITNQPGIARGALTENDLAAIHTQMLRDVSDAGGEITAVYHCPHGWDEGCSCRKPKPGMLFRAQYDFQLDLSRTFFIGDDERDREAALAAGCQSILVSDGNQFLDVAERLTRGML